MQQKNNNNAIKILVIESISPKPHLESAGEIAIRELVKGNNVAFAWLGDNLPWTEFVQDFNKLHRFLGYSNERRVSKFKKILKKNGIDIINQDLNESCIKSISLGWSSNFSGNLADLKKYTYNGISLGLGVASSLITYSGNSCYKPESHIRQVAQALYSALIVYLRAVRIIEQHKPDLIVTFNGRFATARAIVLAGDDYGVPVIRHERGHRYTHYELYSKNIHDLNYISKRISGYWEAGNSSYKEKKTSLAHKFYKDKYDGDGMGGVSFVADQIKGLIPEFKENKRLLIYYSSSDDEYAAIDDCIDTQYWASQIDAVRCLLRVATKIPDLEIVIRVHPHLMKKSQEDKAIWASLRSDDVIVIEPESPIDSYELMKSADIVVSYGSTMGIEAVYWGKPSILLGPSVYTDSGAVVVPRNEEDLFSVLGANYKFEVPSELSYLPFGYYCNNYGSAYRYFKPSSLFDGKFLGKNLSVVPAYIFILEAFGFLNIYRKIKRIFKI